MLEWIENIKCKKVLNLNFGWFLNPPTNGAISETELSHRAYSTHIIQEDQGITSLKYWVLSPEIISEDL